MVVGGVSAGEKIAPALCGHLRLRQYILCRRSPAGWLLHLPVMKPGAWPLCLSVVWMGAGWESSITSFAGLMRFNSSERQLVSSSDGSQGVKYIEYSLGQESGEGETHVPVEMPLVIYVNGREFATLMCSPTKLEHLVAGFLFMADVVTGRDDITFLSVSEDDGTADIEVRPSARLESAFRRRRQLTSGCGGGLVLEELSPFSPLLGSETVAPSDISSGIRELMEHASLYASTGGVHTSALFVKGRLIVLAEDIGRHNTIDKIAGQCLLDGLDAGGGLLATTGRLSSEMISKAGRLAVPIVISRTSPTSLAIDIAQRAGITLVGYARGPNFRLYTHAWRIRFAPGPRSDLPAST